MTRSGPHRAEANGIGIAYECFGEPSDPPLLLVMGLALQMIAWDDAFCERLAARGFRVIRFDNRDVGLSTWMLDAPAPSPHRLLLGRALRRPQEVPYGLDDMAADACGLLDALDIERAHVVGASLGGMIAQVMAIRHPERVRSLTCIMTRARGGRRAGLPRLRTAALLLGRVPDSRAAYLRRAERVWRVLSGPVYPPDLARVRERAAVAWERGLNPPGVRRQLGAILVAPDRTAALQELQVPTLVVHGTLDPLVPPNGGRELAAAVPGAELMMIDGMGHALPEPLWGRIIDRICELAARAAAAERPSASDPH